MQPSGSKLLAGYLAGIGSMLMAVISASCVQALRGGVPDFQLSVIRSAATGLTSITAGMIAGTDFKVGREYVPGLIYYGACFLFYNVGLFGAVTYLPLAELQGIAATAGILFAILQSRLLFNIDIAKSNVIAAVVCVAGIALTTQPPWLFNKGISASDTAVNNFINSSFSAQPQNSSATYGYDLSSQEVLLGYTFSILGGAAYGVAGDINWIILHDVKTVPKTVYTMLVCMVGSIAFMFHLEDPVYVLDFKQFLLVFGHSLASAIASFLTVYTSSILSGPTYCILLSFEVVTMLVSQYTFMHSIKPGNYNWIEVMGCVIIVFGASIPGVIDLLSHRAKANVLP